jgi:uncharacterized protein YndB with AHSA1/START domain
LATVPTTRRKRTIAAPVDELWALISDPHHLPRWWPRVTRVEDVQVAAFTEVMKTKKGKTVRADFEVVRQDEAERVLIWSQRVEGTPFERVLRSAETELRLAPADGAASGQTPGREVAASEVTIELRQVLGRGSSRSGPTARGGRAVPRFGSVLVRRAAAATIDEALDGLERISG